MKHRLFIFAVLLMALSFSLNAQTYGFTAVAPSGQTLHFRIGNGCAELVNIAYDGNINSYSDSTWISGDLIIPDTVFFTWEPLILPDTVIISDPIPMPVCIINNAFKNQNTLHSVVIPNTVTSIDNSAFEGCTGLTSITIPNSVTTIGLSAFARCSGLETITIPSSVTTIGIGAFGGCSGLTSIFLPNSVDSLGGGVFGGCTNLQSITLPNAITKIGTGAFQGCTNLASIAIPSSVVNIGESAFRDCSSLSSVVIPSSVVSISDRAFENCSSLSSVFFSSGVTSIGNSAFALCENLDSISIPNTVQNIGEWAFAGCGAVVLSLPSSVVSIGGNAFGNHYGIGGLCMLYYNGPATGSPWGARWVNGYEEDSLFYTNQSKAILICSHPKITHANIPNSVTKIKNEAFRRCKNLQSVTIGISVDTIEEWAFGYQTNIDSIAIPNTVTSIGTAAFQNVRMIYYQGSATGSPWGALYCNGYYEDSIYYSDQNKWIIVGAHPRLKHATIPNTVFYIGNSAFANCMQLTHVTMPNSVSSMGYWVFSNCASLSSVTLSNQLWMIPHSSFANCLSLESISLPNSVGIIDISAFSGCSSLISVSMPDSILTEIRNGAFLYCEQLSTITLPITLTKIDNYAFMGCRSLTSISIPPAVEYLGEYAFAHCTGLTSVTIPNSLTNIKSWVFGYCTSLDSVTIPNSVTSIGNHAFAGCTSLCSVVIPDSVVSIGDRAFYYCDNLSAVTIGESVSSIGIEAFCGCNRLQSITIPESVEFLSASSFLCDSLWSIWMLGSTPPTLEGTVFNFNQRHTRFHIPCGTKASYQSAWQNYNYDDRLFEPGADFNLNLTSSDSLIGQVTSILQNGSVVGCDSSAIIYAQPSPGYAFDCWSNGNTSNPDTLHLVGDTSVSAFFIIDVFPKLCMVSVQDERNLLMWYKDEVPLNAYNIYREGETSGNYELIATVPYDEQSIWIDETSRPMNHSYRYKISATDIYGIETEESTVHKTMHLTISQGIGNSWNLVWAPYEGATYSGYQIYRGSDMNNMEIIDAFASDGNTTYTDYNVNLPNVYYQVAIVKDEPCNITKSNNIIKSNIATNSIASIENVDAQNLDFGVYSENGHIIVNRAKGESVKVYDMMGRVVATTTIAADYALISLPLGVYVVMVGESTARKVVLK